MHLPDFIMGLPALELPVSEDIVSTRAIRSDKGLAVFFTFHEDFELPPHAHLGQWGTVLAGELHLTMNGTTQVLRPGDTYDIPAGTEHGARAIAGTVALDVFEEPDRYPLR